MNDRSFVKLAQDIRGCLRKKQKLKLEPSFRQLLGCKLDWIKQPVKLQFKA